MGFTVTCVISEISPTLTAHSTQVGGGIPSQGATQLGTLAACEDLLYINGKGFQVPSGYAGYLPNNQEKCDELWRVIASPKINDSYIG